MTQAPTGTRLTEEVLFLCNVLTDAAKQFRLYESLHSRKGTQDGDERALTNAAHALACEAAVAQARNRLTAQGGGTVLQQADSCPPRRRDDAGIGVGTVGSLPPVGAPRAEAAPDAELPPEIEKIAQAWYHEVTDDIPSTSSAVKKRLSAANKRTEDLIEYIRSLRSPQPASPAPTDPRVADVERRRAGLTAWLSDNAPHVTVEQKHLNANTPEQAYWHYGYAVALRDVLALFHPGKPEGEGK